MSPEADGGIGSDRERGWGVLAAFPTPAAVSRACEALRDAGYTLWDAHTPFPVHGLDRAMGLRRSKIPWLVLVTGLGGASSAMLLQWWVAAEAYPLRVAGKPYFSWPAFVPIAFEVGVLGAAIGALVGFLICARLPRHHHPLFASSLFERATDDAFLVSVEAADPHFEPEATLRLLGELGASSVEWIAGEAGGGEE